jgi:hypothetical protein
LDNRELDIFVDYPADYVQRIKVEELSSGCAVRDHCILLVEIVEEGRAIMSTI